MKIPKTIRIGSTEIRVKETKELDRDESDGMYSASQKVIEVREGIAEDQYELVLLHEVLHACADLAGMNDKVKYSEEECVNRITPWLREVLKGNKRIWH